MRIQKLVLKNFRSHEETVLELDRLNFIRGPNGCGKSSILMGLEYLFTGRCALTDAAGRCAEVLIRTGEKELEVLATIASGETVCRRRTAKSQIVEIDGRKVPVDVAEAFLTRQIGKAEVLSTVLNVDRFIEMSAAEQQKLLAQLIPDGRICLLAAISDALQALNEEAPKVAGIADVETAYKRYRELTAEANRALNALEQVEKPEMPVDLPVPQEVERKIQEFRQEKERLLTRSMEADRCLQNAQPRSTSSRTHQEILQHDPRSLADLTRELADLNGEQKTIEASLAALEEAKNCCPTCGQAIVQEAKAQRLQSLGERRDELEALIQGAREELTDRAASAQLEGSDSPSLPHETVTEERGQFLTAHGLRPGDLECQLAILTERINKAERVLGKIRQVESAKEKWESNVREKTSLESRLRFLSTLTDFFGPEGAAMGEFCDAIRSLTGRVNPYLAVFGYACRVSFDPYEIRVSSVDTAPFELTLKQLSESEQFRFGIALQVAVAMATGVKFVVIDRADALDTEKRKMLTSLLVNSGLDQAIVLATGEDAPPSLLPRDVKFVDLARSVKLAEVGA
jgi:DNA repair exonuclease SbcCD ATPase subunit